MPHWHIMLWCAKAGAYGHPLARIGKYIGLSEDEMNHAGAAVCKVGNLHPALYYLFKYGLDKIYPNGKFWESLIKHVVTDIPQDIAADCMNMHQVKRAGEKADLKAPHEYSVILKEG